MTPLTDDQIARHLVRRGGASSGRDLRADARAVTTVRQGRRPPWVVSPRFAAIGAVAVAGVLAAVAFGGALGQIRPVVVAPSGSAPSAPSPLGVEPSGVPTDAPASHAPTAAPLDAWTSIAWAKGSFRPFNLGSHTFVTDVIADGDGFVAVGYSAAATRDDGHIWRSDDGRDWEAVDSSALDGLADPRILRVGDRLVILAERRSTTSRAAIEMRVSTDGRTWTEGPVLPVRLEGDVRSAVGGPLGILLPGAGRTFAIGPDLASWTERPDTAAGTGVLYGGTLVAGPDRWFLVGATGSVDAGAPPTVGAIWTSPDGEEWVPATVERPGGVIGQILAVDGGYVAVGSNLGLPCSGCLGVINLSRVAWFSADGATWTRLELPVLKTGDLLFGTTLVGDGHRVIAKAQPFGDGPATGAIHETIDGRTWTLVAVAGSAPPDINAMAVGAHGIVVIASTDLGHRGTDVPVPWWGAALEGR